MPLLPISDSCAHQRLPGDSRGIVSIEFAILLPVFLAILFGIIVFGIQYTTRIALTYAASEGGRAAVAGLTNDERKNLATTAITRTLNAFAPLVNPAKASISVDFSNLANSKEVTISIAYNDLRFAALPFVPQLGNLAPVTVSYFVTDPSG